MQENTGTSQSVWMATSSRPEFKQLTTDIETDVCVIGAGISGLSVAYQLACEGRKVVILDRGALIGGETERTTAHLANAMDDRFTVLEQLHGERGSTLAAKSHGGAIDRIEEIVRSERIACDFERLDGYLFLGPDDDIEMLKEELAAAHRAGLGQVELMDRAPVQTFNTGPCLRFPRQGQFHPIKYLTGLTAAILARGVTIYTHTHVLEIEDGTPAQIRTKGGARVRASAVVVATNTPINDRFTIHTKQAPYRTYAVAGRVAAGVVSKGLYWDTMDPYHYVRLQSYASPGGGGEHQLLIVGGEDHKTGQEENPERSWSKLEEWTRERFKVGAFDFRWSGQVMEPIDGLGFIGRNPGDKNVYIATGDSGQGLTHGTIAGALISDLILGRKNEWEDLYDQSRKTLRSIKDFAQENLNVAAQYRDYVTAGDAKSAEVIPRGEGCVLRHGLKKVAVYCDESGARHEISAICPHLGCIVAWNSAEKTWDCPCHGSRFGKTGEVMNGPAVTGLKQIAE